MTFWIRLVLFTSFLYIPAHAASEREHQARLCLGMDQEWVLNQARGRVDCKSAEYAIEIDWVDNWHGSIGQALWYSWETGLKPAVILICKRGRGACRRHYGLFRKTLSEWDLPVSSWYCRERDETLDHCEFVAR